MKSDPVKFAVASWSFHRPQSLVPARALRPLRVAPRAFSSRTRMDAKFAPAKRVAGQKQDVWSIVNEAAAASPKQPIVNMGQGFL
jgi:hypothetical protein